jgi:hypothetical protein
MVKSVVREYKWSPDVIGNLYVDEVDYQALIYWYNDVLVINKELKSKPIS